MRILKKTFILSFIFIYMATQTGCWDLKQFEDIGFILQMGLESDQEGKMIFSMTAPVVSPDAKGKVEFLTTSSENLIRSSRDKLRDVSGRMLQGGKIQLVYFSKDLARKGIGEFFEIFLRDPENPLLANVVVVDGSPKEMMELSLNYSDKPRPAFYANELLQDARRRTSAPESRIYHFSVLSNTKTIDPVAPIVRYNDKSIEVAGSALFNGDRMVGEIDTFQTILLNMLIDNQNKGEYIYKGTDLNENESRIKKGSVVTIKKQKKKIKIDTSGKQPVIDIQLQLKVILDEYAATQPLDKKSSKEKLEEILAKDIQTNTTILLKHLQEIGSDPVGFGELVRAKNNEYFKSVQWKDVYRNADIKVDVKLNVDFYGTIR